MDKNMEQIIANFTAACNDLAELVNQRLFNGERDGWYWVGDAVGGICDYGDTDFLGTENMLLILVNNVSYEQYAEWRDANIEYAEKGHINLKSCLLGCRHYMLRTKDKK